jgi:putative sugar O-methyltransferase
MSLLRKSAKPDPAPEVSDWQQVIADSDAAIRSVPEPWGVMLRHSLEQLVDADPLYAPTHFWQPGVRALLADLERYGLEEFKRWPSAHFFFYPLMQPVFSYAMVDQVMPKLRETAPNVPERWFRDHLVGSSEAHREMDIILAALDIERLPLNIDVSGESKIGSPPQWYRPLGTDGPGFGKPHLNYLKILAATSRYIDHPVHSTLEIGAGFGALGEILLSSFPDMQYVDIDIPPLSVVAHYYLSQRFPEMQTIASSVEGAAAETRRVGKGHNSACLSTFDLPNLQGEVDLFVNSFSFQEMEPHVVDNYVEQISRLQTKTVVSLNSRRGKPKRDEAAVGVQSPVTSDDIVKAFAQRGYEPVARLGRPFAPPQAELVIMQHER